MRCLFLNPRFRTASFWNYRATCEGAGARYPAAPLGLITVAALLPQEWEMRLVDCNVHTWKPELLDWADLVLVGGMLPQQLDALDLIRQAKARGKTVVMGGPDATSSPHVYAEADHLVLGEVEATMARFVEDLRAGTAQKTYQDPERPDITTSPCPRYDLLDLDKYLHIGVQWCRGCPFSCEFCDIIELYGRKPRAKNTEQMLAEMQRLYELGYRGHIDFVDDNFIGNKNLAKKFLPHLRVWLEERDWPFEFSTEASVNLADDEELLGLMREVGFFAIFVGIESPDEATLIATQKRQNTRRSIADGVRKITEYGIYVNAGYILGFDTEQGSAARGIIECIEETAIPVNMVGLLHALPNTQLTRRLEREGRLHPDHCYIKPGQGDQCTAGLNFEPKRPRADILRDYLEVIETVYRPEAYFQRVLTTCLRLDASSRRMKYGWKGRLRSLRAFLSYSFSVGVVRNTRGLYWNLLWKVGRKNPKALYHAVSLAALYLHFGPFAAFVAQHTRRSLEEELARGSAAALPDARRTALLQDVPQDTVAAPGA
jgi:radical SAM superfamily enzyme YgiQ (UPF0313 family)